MLYSIKLYIGIVILIKFASPTRVPSISVELYSNGAQFLNATWVASVSGYFTFFGRELSPVTAAIVLVTAIFPVTKIYAPE